MSILHRFLKNHWLVIERIDAELVSIASQINLSGRHSFNRISSTSSIIRRSASEATSAECHRSFEILSVTFS